MSVLAGGMGPVLFPGNRKSDLSGRPLGQNVSASDASRHVQSLHTARGHCRCLLVARAAYQMPSARS